MECGSAQEVGVKTTGAQTDMQCRKFSGKSLFLLSPNEKCHLLGNILEEEVEGVRVLRVVEDCCHAPSIAHLHARRANRLCISDSELCWPGRKLKIGSGAATGFAGASTP